MQHAIDGNKKLGSAAISVTVELLQNAIYDVDSTSREAVYSFTVLKSSLD